MIDTDRDYLVGRLRVSNRLELGDRFGHLITRDKTIVRLLPSLRMQTIGKGAVFSDPDDFLGSSAEADLGN